MTGAQQDDVLSYNNSNDRFEPVSIDTIVTNSNPPMIMLYPANSYGTEYQNGVEDYNKNLIFTEVDDPNNLFSQDATTGVCTFASGTYLIDWGPMESARWPGYWAPYSGTTPITTNNTSGTIMTDGYERLSQLSTSDHITLVKNLTEQKFDTNSYTNWALVSSSNFSNGQQSPMQTGLIKIYKIG
jgi:hypothetical protein